MEPRFSMTRPVRWYCLVHPPIVLLIAAKSLVLFKNYVKIVQLAVDTRSGTDSSQAAPLLHRAVFGLIVKLSVSKILL